MKKQIKLCEEVSNCFDRCAYEKTVSEFVVALMIDRDYDQTSELFKERHLDMVKTVIRYEECRNIINELATSEKIKNWTVKYREGIMEYEI